MATNDKGENADIELAPAMRGHEAEDTALVGSAVEDLNELYVRKGLEFYVEVGTYLLERFYGNDIGNLRATGKSHTSLRALAEDDRLNFSHTTLWNSLAVVDQLQCLPDGVGAKLTFSHHRLLFPIRDDERKAELAEKVVEKGWTVKQLQSELGSQREGSKRGRPSLPAFVKTIRSWKHLVGDEAKAKAFAQLGDVDKLDEAEAEQLYRTVTAMKLKCEELQEALAPKVPGFRDPE